jgi:iron(III) transport system substrate-binding protein
MRPMSGWKRTGAVFGALALTVAAAACGGGEASGDTAAPATNESASAEWTATIDAAKKEGGKANLYTTEVPAWIDSIVEGFKKETGLEMAAAVRGGSGTIEERLAAEVRGSAVGADVFSVIDRDYFTTHKDWFVNLAQAGLPNYESYPADAKWQDTCIVIKTSVSGVLYNNQLVPSDKVPETWEDLLDPYWKGKFLLIDPRASNSPMGWAVQMQKAYGMDYLKGISAHNPALATSTAPAAEQVAAGAYAITVTSQADSSSALRAKGAPLTFVVPKDGPTLGNAACIGILKDGKNPNTARVLLNYLMTKDAQSLPCKAGVEVQSPMDADGCYKVASGWKSTPVDPTTGVIEGTDNEALEKDILNALDIK